MAQYKKEDIIDSIVKMRINEMASTRTIIKIIYKINLDMDKHMLMSYTKKQGF